MSKSSKFLALVAITSTLLVNFLPQQSLVSSANAGDTSNFTPDRLGRNPVVVPGGNVEYDAYPFATFNNYTNLQNLEADRILVRNNSYDDIRDNSDRTGDERQFLSARPQVFISDNPTVLQQLGPDHVGPGTDSATARDLKFAQDPLLLSKASLQNTTGDLAYDNAKVRFYLYVHNNGEPPAFTGTAFGRQATNTRVYVNIPTEFQESPEVTGYISADNVTYYPNMNLPNSTITSQTALSEKTISDSVVVHLTNNGYYSGGQNRFMLRPDASSLQFIEHNNQLIVGGPDNNEYQFNAPRTLATGIGGATSFFNPTGTGLNRGLPLTSSQNNVQISPDGTIIGCFQNAGYLTFLADVVPEPTATAPVIKKYVSTTTRASGDLSQTAINGQFFDANSTGQAVDFGEQTSTFRANYRVTITNDSQAPITGLTISDTFFASDGSTATAPQIISESSTSPLTPGSLVDTFSYSGAGNETAVTNPTNQVTYTNTTGDHINFTLPLLPAGTTTSFYYDALIPAPVGSTNAYHRNDARILTCDQGTGVCGLPNQHDPAYVLAVQTLPTPVVDVEKYVTNQLPTGVNLLTDIANNNAIDRANINLYQDADTSTQAVRFNADGTLPSTSFTGNFLVKLQKATRTTSTARIYGIAVDDSYYQNRTTYSSTARARTQLAPSSVVTTYFKILENTNTGPRIVVAELANNSSTNALRVSSTTVTSGLVDNLYFNSPNAAILGGPVSLPVDAIQSAATTAGALTVSSTINGTLMEILYSYQATLPTPSQSATENSFNRASVISYSYQQAGDSVPGFINNLQSVQANCAIEILCDDASLVTQPPTPPTVKKYVSTAVRPTSATTVPSTFIDGETATAGSAADFGAQNSSYITYYRVTVTNNGTAPLNNLALEDQFFLRNDTAVTAQNVVDNAGSTLANGTVLASTYTVSGSNETAVATGNRVTYVGPGSTTNAIRFTIPTVGAGQTVAFYYNVLVNPTLGTRPTGVGYHRNEAYVCFPPTTTGCTPGSRDIAFSSDIPGTVNVTITKDVNGQPADTTETAVTVPNGTALNYVITVTAPSTNGSVSLTNVQISDNMLAGLPNVNSISNIRLTTPTGTCSTPCTLANLGTALAGQTFTLAAGQSATLTYSAVGVNTGATPSIANINTATVTTTQTGPRTNPAVVIVTGVTPGTPTLSITKDVNSQPADTDHTAVVVNSGDTLNYLITVRNTGTVNVTNIVLSDTLVGSLPNVTNVSNIRLITPTGTCVSATPCSLANLGTALAAQTFTLTPGQTATLSYSATATNTGTSDSAYNRNTATATPSNASPVSNPAVVQVRGTATLHTDFRIRKEASPQVVRDGDEVTYTIRVSPRGTNDQIPNLTLLITDDINDDGTLTGDNGVKFTYIRNSTKIRVSDEAECDGEMDDEDGIRCEDVSADEDIRITYRVRVSAPNLRNSDTVIVDNTAQLRDDTPNVNIRDEADASVQVIGIETPPPPAQPIGIEKTVTPGKVKRGEIANYTIIITNPNAEAETHRVVDTIGLNNGVVPGQSGGLVRFNPDSLRVEGALYTSGTIGNAEGLTFTIPGNGRIVITYTATGEPAANSRTVSLAPNTATLDTGAYAVAFVELPTTGPVGLMVVFTLSALFSAAFVYRKKLLAFTK